MKLIKATSQNLDAIMQILTHAQYYLASLNIDQWQNGYPNKAIINNDINNQETYIIINNQNQIMATAMFTIQPEPTYANIEGQWLTSQNQVYGVIHRMAVHNDFRSNGTAKFIFQTCEDILKQSKINSMRIDTHQDNKAMQQLLNKMDYIHCGTIYLNDGNKRLAYEKIIF